MLTGFNTNVRHRGVQFHVQTEDSGRARPHLISHLYHGGVILASERCEYAGQASSAKLAREVRALMEEQHQAMLRRLKAGEFDELIDQHLGRGATPAVAAGSDAPASTQPAPAPTRPAATPTQPAPAPTRPAAAPTQPAPAPTRPAATPTQPALAPTEPVLAAKPPAAGAPRERDERAFGAGIVSEKPLDEVILEYLVGKARDREPKPKPKRAGAAQPARRSRAEE